jgi:hypothetical protein
LVLGLALGMAHLGELGDGLGGVEEVDQLATGVVFEKDPVARRTVGDADETGVGLVLFGPGGSRAPDAGGMLACRARARP